MHLSHTHNQAHNVIAVRGITVTAKDSMNAGTFRVHITSSPKRSGTIPQVPWQVPRRAA